MRLTYIFIITLLSLPILGFGQHFPQHSQYFLNNYLLNPALGGIEEYIDVKLSSRSQWSNIQGAPLTNYLSIHLPLKFSNKPNPYNESNSSTERMQKKGRTRSNFKPHHGIGGWILQDRSGNYRRFDFNLSYSYHLRVSKNTKLALGIAGGSSQRNINFSGVQLANNADPILAAGTENRWQPMMMAGAWLYKKYFYVGASFLRYFTSDRFSNISEESNIVNVFSEQFFVTAAYKLEVNPTLKIIPSVLLKKFISGSPLLLDLNTKVVFHDRLWGGISFRELQTLNTFIGFALSPALEVNYSYDFGFGGFDRYSVGNHEILIGFRFMNNKKIHCPNYFW